MSNSNVFMKQAKSDGLDEMMANQWTTMLTVSLLILLNSGRIEAAVPKVILHSAVAEGAVCLDGSPPAYYFDEGKDEGASNWIIYLSGGGWCTNNSVFHTDNTSVDDCAYRMTGPYGSSKWSAMTYDFSKSQLSSYPNISFFYNWNRVLVQYCDGASFSGDVEEIDPVTKLYYRGARIFQAVTKELMGKGMKNAQNVIFAGGSAGGLGVMIHCDRFRNQFPKDVRVKCFADSSFFINVKGSKQSRFFDNVFGTLVDLHQITKALPTKCTSKRSALSCLFPKSLLQYVKTPIYILNPAFDSYQIRNTFSEDLNNAVESHAVRPSDMALLQDFRQQLITVLPPPSVTKGYLITSRYGHSLGWSFGGYKISMFPDKKSKTIESALLDWFFDRSAVNIIDPSNEPYDE